MNKKEIAVHHFNSSFNCCQSVVATFAEEYGLSKEMALKVATGFGGGMRFGEVCGALTGALMVLGLKDGHFVEGDFDKKAKTNGDAKEFIEKFRAKNGDITCKKLLGYDLSIPEEHEILLEKGLFKSICPKLVESSVELLEETLKA